MKLHLPLGLFAAVLACMAPLSAEFAYLADGVNESDLIHSERFYDNGKGVYWSYSGYQPIKGAAAVYKSAGWDAFGALTPRMVHTAGVTTQTFSHLTDDGNTCGYQVPVNMMQYWQSYYGVFYKGSEELPYGFNYSREYLDDFGGTQSLELGMLFYDNWQNTGNNVLYTSLWYMKGETHRLMRDPASGGGGYFADYYAGYDTCRYYDNVNTKAQLKEAILGSFALEEQADGSYVCTEVGRLMYVGLSSPTVDGGHAITCYGFDMDDAGNVVSMKMVNSDDMAYKLFTVYVKEYDGHLYLYNDAACTAPWKYAGGSWYLNDLAHLITPDILKQMYAVYSAEETPLSWNGEGGAWSASAKSTTDALPTAATGWDVRIGSEAYHSYYYANRPVLFDDGAASGNVSVSGAIAVPAMVLANTELPYSFTGGTGATVSAPELRISGGGSAVFKNVTLSTGETSFSNYTLSFGGGAVFKAAACTVGSGGTLELAGGKAAVTSLTLGKGGTLAVTAAGSVLTSSLTMGAGSEMYLVLSGKQTSAALFSVSGSLTLSGAANIEIGGAASLVSGSTYMLCSIGSGSVDVAQLSTAYGDLSFNNKVLYLTYQALPSLAWTSGSGTWSSTRWQGAEQDTAHADVSFTGGSGAVTVSGAVNPHSLTLSGGSYTLNGSGASVAVDKAVRLSGGAALTSNVPLSASRFELQGSASLTLNPGVNQTLDYLTAEEKTRLTLNGSRLTYTLNGMGALSGAITVGSGATLRFRCATGAKLGGTLASADATSAVAFTNASASAPIVYRAGNSLADFSGSVTVGSDTDAQGTTLSIGFTPAKGTYNVRSNGTLELNESAKVSAKIEGSGTLRVAEGTQCEFLLSSHRPSYATTLALDAAGSVSVGNAFSVSQSAVARALTVSGDLTVYAGSGTFNYGSVTLNGGNYTVCMPYVDGDSKDIIQNISALTVGTKGGTVCGRHEDAAYFGQYARTNINNLSGSGDLTLSGSHFMGLNYYYIASVDKAGYSGNITVYNTLDPTLIPDGNQVSLELASCTLPGAVALKSYSSNTLCRITLGLKGDVALGGLDSDGNGSAYLYSGYIRDLHADMTEELPEKQVETVAHTLTLNTAGTHSFAGKVMGPLHLVKEGSGTQQFTGDMSAWKGKLTVKQGKVSFGSALTMSGKLTMSGGTLQAGKLVTSAGASFSGCGTLLADSVADSAGWSFTLSQANEDTPVLTLGSLSGSAGLSLRSLNISYDAASLTNGTYKLLQYNADFGGELKGITLGGDCSATVIGTKGSSDVYFTTATVGGKSVYTLMLDVNGALSAPNRDTATTLTWLPATGVWQQESGHEEKLWSGSAVNLNFLNGDTVIFNKAATVSIAGEVSPAEVRVQNGSGNVTIDGSGSIVGEGSLNKSGAGQLTLNTANAYSGGTAVSGGTLTAGHAAALGSGAVSLSSGTLALGNNAVSNAVNATGGQLSGTAYCGTLTVSGTVKLNNDFRAAAVNLQSGSLSGGSIVDTAVNAAGGTLSSALSGSTQLTSTGTVTLSSANTYSGGTVVNGGTLAVSHAAALGRGAVSLNDGTLVLGAYAVTNAVTATGGSLSGTAFAGDLTVQGALALVGNVTAAQVHLENGTLTGVLAGAASVISSGSSKLSGNNTYSGGTILEDGTLTIAHAHALGSGAVQMSGGTLVLGSYAADNAIETTGGTINGGTAYRGDLTVNGAVTLGSSSFKCSRLTLESGTLSGGGITGGTVVAKGGTLASALRGTAVLDVQGDVVATGSFSPASLLLSSGTLTADVSTAACSVTAAGGALNGALTLNGGTLTLAESLRVSGALTLSDATVLDVSAYTAAGTYTLLSAGSISGAASLLSCAPVPGRAEYSLAQRGNDILLTVISGAATHEWTAAKGVLAMGTAIGDDQLLAGDFLEIGAAAAITVSGELLPGGVAVTADKNVTFTADKKVAGSGIAGSGSVTKSGAGMLTLNAGNTYSGGTVLNAGTIKASAADSFGSGNITVNGGTLDLGGKDVHNDIVLAGAATIKGDAKYAGSVTVEGDATLLAKTSYKGVTTIGAGSSLTLAASATVAGSLAVDGGVLRITAPKGLTLAKNTSLTLDKGGSVRGLLTVASGSTLVWGDGGFATAAPVLNGGTLDLGGKGSLTLTGSKAQVQFGDKAVSLPGKGIVQTADELTLNSGTVTVNAVGNYTDAIIVNGGTLKLTTGKTATYNTVIVNGNAAVANGTTHYGDIIVNGTLAKGTAIKLLSPDQKVELNGSGSMLGTISGTGRVEVKGNVDITAGGKLSNTDILLTGTLTHTKGWTLAKGQTLTLNGGSVNGALNIGSGAVLAMNDHTLSAAPVLKGGTADFGGSHTLALTGSKGDISIENQDFSLLSKSFVKSNGALTVNGGIVTVNDFGGSQEDITVKGGTLKLATGKLTSANTIKVSGDAAVANGTTHYGDIIVNGTLAKGTAIKLLSSGQKVQLNGAGPLLGSISGAGIVEVNASIDATAATLTAANIALNHGTYTNTKGIRVAKGQTLTLNGAALNLGPKGVLSTAAGSTLAVNGNTSISGSLTLGGGSLVFSGTSLEVQGTLTLSTAMNVTGSGIITYDTLKAAKNVDVEKLFGKGAVLDTVNGTLSFGDYLPMAAVMPETHEEPELTAAAEPALSSEPATAMLAAAPQKQEAETVAALAPLSLPAANPVADALVQSDWAVLETARAFTGSIRNRSMGTLTQDGRGAVWAAAVGSYARHGSEGLHSGSRENIYGGSIGAKHAVGERHSLGVALGSTHTMVERTAMSRLRQNATHFALYGNSRLNGKLSADWTAAIGAADMHGRVGATTAEWEQNSGALNARLNYTERLNERTALRAYAGAEYAATDADRVDGYKTGGVQTLRGELGASLTHSRENAQFFAELGLVNDLLRHNPTVDCGSYRTRGANPGRTSLKAAVGGSVQLNESWSANAAYSIESAADATQQSINIGVSRSF